MTINTIKESHGNRYTYTIVDASGFYWEENCGKWYAIGEWGWIATDEEINAADIEKVTIDNNDKIIYVFVKNSL